MPGNKGFLTCSLRPCFTIGERFIDGLGRIVASAQGGWAKYQLGNSENLYDFVYVGNVADAHVLAAQPLQAILTHVSTARSSISLTAGPGFSGTFNARSQHRQGTQSGRGHYRCTEVLALTIGLLIGYLVWAVSLESRSPTMTRDGIRFSTITRTISGDKAMRVLGYQPRVSVQEGIERGVK